MKKPLYRILRVGIAAGLMAASAICFLKYAWWAACYSGWYGLKDYADQITVAGHRAQLYFWAMLLLQLATLLLFFNLLTLRDVDLGPGPRFLARLGLSAAISLGFTAFLMVLINRFALRTL